MRYRLMATYRGVPYEAGVGPAGEDVVLFAACPPPEELGFEPAPGHWRKRVVRREVDALWESRPVGIFGGEPCLALDDLGDRLHIAYLGTDSDRATALGYWQVDRGVFELLTPREEVTGLAEERVERPLSWNSAAPDTGPVPACPSGTAPWPVQSPPPAVAPPAPGPAAPDGRWDSRGPEPVPSVNGSAAAHVSGSPPAPPGSLPPLPQLDAYPPDPYAPPASGPVPGAPAGFPDPRYQPAGTDPDAAWPGPAPAAADPVEVAAPSVATGGPGLSQPAPALPGPPLVWDAAPGRAVPSRDGTGSHAVPLARAVAAGQAAAVSAAAQQAGLAPDGTSSHPILFPAPGADTSGADTSGANRSGADGSGAVRPGPGGGRAARRQRVPTQAIFCELADLAAIPRHAYALEAETDGAMCLLHTGNGYEVFVAAEGARHEIRTFADEEAAYFYLFGVLAAEAIRNGGLAPQ